MREVWDGRKMEVRGKRIVLVYADDIVVMEVTREIVITIKSYFLPFLIEYKNPTSSL
jgi:hypothetical protein